MGVKIKKKWNHHLGKVYLYIHFFFGKDDETLPSFENAFYSICLTSNLFGEKTPLKVTVEKPTYNFQYGLS